jgi:hypothetical protein
MSWPRFIDLEPEIGKLQTTMAELEILLLSDRSFLQ